MIGPGRPDDELSVGQVADRSGLTVSALHFYEREGLIHSERNAGNQRRFARETLRRLAFIRASQRVGIPLADIRAALDGAGHTNVAILGYSAKYASGEYGPFRDAAGSTPSFGDRRSHQMDVANTDEAMRVTERDIREGADIVMVKPAVTYLDVVSDLRAALDVPICAYHVSGEYAMIKAAAERGWLDATAVAVEQLTAVRRAGADFVLTYFARELAEAWA